MGTFPAHADLDIDAPDVHERMCAEREDGKNHAMHKKVYRRAHIGGERYVSP
jgi:hypothetical protein